MEQAVLTDFIAEGHFARHVRRTRLLYAERQSALVDAATRELAGLLEVGSAEAGMHLVGYLPEGVDDRAIAQQAAAYKVEAPALSSYAQTPLRRGGLLLGYAAFNQAEIQQGIRRLATALRSTSTNR
jgi:GntR family transcriptional regulator/MocR family aminotransferase